MTSAELDAVTLASQQGFPRISIYLPTHERGPEIKQDMIRLKNAISTVEKDLLAAGLRRPDVEAILADASQLLDDDAFWQYQSLGLAVFIADSHTQVHKVPVRVPEQTFVADRYHIRPLIRLHNDDQTYYALAINRDQVSMYRCDRHNVDLVNVDAMPQSIADVGPLTRFVDGKAKLSAHDSLPAQREANFSEADVDEFVKAIANAVETFLAPSRAPLVVIAGPRLGGLFAKYCAYAGLMDDRVEKNTVDLDATDIHSESLAVATPALDQRRLDAVSELRSAFASGDAQVSADISDVVRAAIQGRVKTAFVADNGILFGRADETGEEVEVGEQAAEHPVDLADLVAGHTLVNGGAVRIVSADTMQEWGPVAALFRY